MTQVEKLILDPKTELESVGRKRDVDENKRRKTKAESEENLCDGNTTPEENLILSPQAEMKSVSRQHDEQEIVKQDEAIDNFELDKKWKLCGIL